MIIRSTGSSLQNSITKFKKNKQSRMLRRLTWVSNPLGTDDKDTKIKREMMLKKLFNALYVEHVVKN